MPTSRKFNFEGNDGQVLAGRLELPDGEAAAFAIFAHCFTCSKNIKAASRISRGLAELGIGVLRFDFTGLGNSEGDFSNTNFSSNVEDLISAIEALGQAYQAPSLLVGHSLGGTAALVAASRASEIKAVATIGSPADPEHVTHLFGDKLCEIETRGAYDVDLAGRKFTIRKQLLDDVRGFGCGASLTSTGKAVLILHSPQDELVEIEQARLIYERLKHPKSFVSLDGADHLLTSEEDSEFVAELIAAWAKRYVGSPEPTQQSVVRQLDEPSTANAEAQLRAGAVQVREVKGFTQLIQTRDHSIWADEPSSVGGDHKGMKLCLWWCV